MKKNKKNIDLAYVDIERLESGIIIQRYKDRINLDLGMIKELIEYNGSLNNFERKPMCAVLSEFMTIDKEVRDYGKTAEATRYTSASAIVVKSLGHRLLGNFFIKVQKPAVPTKLFSEEKEAIEWLKTYL